MILFRQGILSIGNRIEFWRRTLIILLAVIITVPVIWKSRPSIIPYSQATFHANTSSTGFARVSGDVRHPGIYPVSAKTVTADVIELAAPLTHPKTYLPQGIETSAIISGTEFIVKLLPDGSTFITCGSLPVKQRLVLGIPLNINSLTEADFDLLPGIGPALANRIFEYRRKNGGSMAVHELLQVEGIGEKKFIALSKYFN